MEIQPKFLNFLKTFWNPDDFTTVPISLLPALKIEIFLKLLFRSIPGGNGVRWTGLLRQLGYTHRSLV